MDTLKLGWKITKGVFIVIGTGAIVVSLFNEEEENEVI